MKALIYSTQQAKILEPGNGTRAKTWFDKLTTLSNVERAKHAKFGGEE